MQILTTICWKAGSSGLYCHKKLKLIFYANSLSIYRSLTLFLAWILIMIALWILLALPSARDLNLLAKMIDRNRDRRRGETELFMGSSRNWWKLRTLCARTMPRSLPSNQRVANQAGYYPDPNFEKKPDSTLGNELDPVPIQFLHNIMFLNFFFFRHRCQYNW